MRAGAGCWTGPPREDALTPNRVKLIPTGWPQIDGQDGQKRWVSRGFAIAQYATAAEATYAVSDTQVYEP